jgi:hypothetical protein
MKAQDIQYQNILFLRERYRQGPTSYSVGDICQEPRSKLICKNVWLGVASAPSAFRGKTDSTIVFSRSGFERVFLDAGAG